MGNEEMKNFNRQTAYGHFVTAVIKNDKKVSWHQRGKQVIASRGLQASLLASSLEVC